LKVLSFLSVLGQNFGWIFFPSNTRIIPRYCHLSYLVVTFMFGLRGKSHCNNENEGGKYIYHLWIWLCRLRKLTLSVTYKCTP
jgi:hypothetical protein